MYTLGIIFLSVLGLFLLTTIILFIINEYNYQYEDERNISFMLTLIILVINLMCSLIDTYEVTKELDKDYELIISKDKIIVLVDDSNYKFEKHKDYKILSDTTKNIDFYFKIKENIFGFGGKKELKYKINK